MRKITADQVAAARRKADKYFPAAPHAAPPARRPAMTDDMRAIARYLFGAPMASVFGNVERSQAIDALSRLAGVPYQTLEEEFDARRCATRAAHEIVQEKYAGALKKPARHRR